MGQFPGGGGGFCFFNSFRRDARLFEHILHVFFLPFSEEENVGYSSIFLNSPQLRHFLLLFVGVFIFVI